VPKTIDGDLQGGYIEASFGFDTACKTYSELIGNIVRDANSARKYWHFIKLMGRSASHIALECALQCRPNICLISEEVAAKRLTLSEITASICEAVVARAERGENFGVVLIPEGLVEFIPEMKALITELNDLGTKHNIFNAPISFVDKKDWLQEQLSPSAWATFAFLPEAIAVQFLSDRDPHGNVQVSRIDTEKLLALAVESKLDDLKAERLYKGKFSSTIHFFGYEGRCAFPSNFDADYCYTLGSTAAALLVSGLTGYIVSVRNLIAPARQWIPGGIPLPSLMNIEKRQGEQKPVIRKALVDLHGTPFKTFEAERRRWALDTCFIYPGSIQYFGPPAVCDRVTKTLEMEGLDGTPAG
jgi:pyrophosphate--fructose-6-phosphate 1-phosphotransferase